MAKTNEKNLINGQPLMVSVDKILQNPDQPRKYYNEAEITKLAESIKAKGIIEPLVARVMEGQENYQLIVGHRRLMAAKAAGIAEVPIIITDLPDNTRQRLEIAMLENIFRENLNPIEEAEGYNRLINEIGIDVQEVAQLFCKDRSTVINSIRLLELPDTIKDDIRYNRMSAGHGRAVLSIINPNDVQEARGIILSQALTVREAENLAKKLNNRGKVKKIKGHDHKAYYESLGSSFSESLGGLKVNIKYKGQKKRVDIFYTKKEDISMIMKKLGIVSFEYNN
jgi:ParB family chromosome partitioning protein